MEFHHDLHLKWVLVCPKSALADVRDLRTGGLYKWKTRIIDVEIFDQLSPYAFFKSQYGLAFY